MLSKPPDGEEIFPSTSFSASFANPHVLPASLSELSHSPVCPDYFSQSHTLKTLACSLQVTQLQTVPGQWLTCVLSGSAVYSSFYIACVVYKIRPKYQSNMQLCVALLNLAVMESSTAA